MADQAAPTEDERYAAARRKVEAKKAFFAHAFVYVLVNLVFLFVAGWTWLWVTLFWGIGLATQAWTVFFQETGWVKNWEHRQIQKELARGQDADTTRS